jgi:glucose-6-phosphate 1-dehydrogenase
LVERLHGIFRLQRGIWVEERTVTSPEPAPCTIVIFGAVGDLTKRLLMPAIYNLAGSKMLDDRVKIIGLDHNDRTTEIWRSELNETLQSFTKAGGAEFHPDHIDEATWDWVSQRLEYTVFDFEQSDGYEKLKDRISGNAIFYLAVSPRFFATIAEGLGRAGLLKETDGAFRRLAVEKPFGSDLPSARALNARLLTVASEAQIYRVDHFLGKEPVQGIMPLRFSNGIYEPMWSREHIDSVQITAAETLGVEERGKFYEATGALRDMIPNHLLSLVTMTAMEAPRSFTAEAVRDAKAELLKAIRPIAPGDTARGQYAAGAMNGKDVRAYRDEENVAPDSHTETFAALAVQIDNHRWNGVPFYVRTGKRLARHLTTIAILLKAGNVLTLGIAPDQGFSATFQAKKPGPVLETAEACSVFTYKDFFEEPPAVGYETLLYHLMTGDPMLFQREDMVDASWTAVAPVLDAWGASHEVPPPYAPGSAGPNAAAELLGRTGRRWLPLN